MFLFLMLLVVASLGKMEKNSVIFATAVATIIQLGNARGRELFKLESQADLLKMNLD